MTGNNPAESGLWIMTYAGDSRPGDLIRTSRRRDARRLTHRTYPDLTSATFQASFEGGETETIGKLRSVEIFDPDGSVLARVRELSAGPIQ